MRNEKGEAMGDETTYLHEQEAKIMKIFDNPIPSGRSIGISFFFVENWEPFWFQES
jgi:hypothetical protein